MIETIKSIVPKPIKRGIRKCQRWVSVLFRNPMVPAKEDNFVSGPDGSEPRDFLETGREFFHYFKIYGGLQPTHRVLDIGSGQGRMALPLTGFLSGGGEYVGVEIVRNGVLWCQEKYRKFPNFRFIHADIYNKNYNPNGTIRASRFQFPCDDESFDFVFLTSVFTHMCPEDMQRYLAEIARCMKRGGRCLITFFLLNAESEEAIRSGKSAVSFRHKVFDVCQAANPDNVEAAIGYREQYVLDAFRRNKLSLIGDIHYGKWPSRARFLSFQDIVIAEKKDDVGSEQSPS